MARRKEVRKKGKHRSKRQVCLDRRMRAAARELKLRARIVRHKVKLVELESKHSRAQSDLMLASIGLTGCL